MMLVFLCALGSLTRAQEVSEVSGLADLIMDLPGYSAALPLEFCKSKFPHHKIIPRAMRIESKTRSFDLFAFTPFVFDSKKPSLVAIMGGPGGIWSNDSARDVAQTFHRFNVIFFHYRGGGCSDFRNNQTAWDSQLSSDGVIGDLEAIRRAYGIARWRGVMGWSYGTNIARRYARRFPERTGMLILEGLDEPYGSGRLSADQQAERLISTVENRFKNSNKLLACCAEFNVSKFTQELRTYFGKIDPETNFSYAAAWEMMREAIELPYLSIGQPVPKHISLTTFLAISVLIYEGEEEEADYAILALMQNFELATLSVELTDFVNSRLLLWGNSMFTFKNADYVKNLENGSLVSWRVQLKMTENDLLTPIASLCTSQPMIVINGTKDLATPIENAESYLNNKSCARAKHNILLSVEGGGHSNYAASMSCINDFVNRSLLKQRTVTPDLKNCDLTVLPRKF